MLNRAQRHGFKFEDKPFEVLMEEYPKCKSVNKWWSGLYQPVYSQYNIWRNKWLKEFLMENPPKFKISSKCCDYAKKNVSHKYIKDNGVDCVATGIRRVEGGVRAVKYSNCFSEVCGGYDQYRPLFWYKDEDEAEYIEVFGVENSDCYVVWGLSRTGCVGCPFAKDLWDELVMIEKYEPKMYKAVCNVFKDSYAYTREYNEFCEKMEATHGSYAGHLKATGKWVESK